MRTSNLLPTLFFVAPLLSAAPAAGQTLEPAAVEAEPAGPLRAEPDSATRRLYARHRVRAILRLRLDEEGNVRDTVGYQEFDRQGHLLVHAATPRHTRGRHEWSYNPKGQCVVQIDHPSGRRPFLTIYAYNPGLRRGNQEAVLADGTRLLLHEVQVHRQGDTTLMQFTSHARLIGGQTYGQDRTTRAFEFVPHPDTLLTLSYGYNPKGRLVFSEARYQLRRRGRPVESGHLSLRKLSKFVPPASATNDVVLLGGLRRLLLLDQGRTATDHWHYDGRGRVVRHEQKSTGANGAPVFLTRRFTYNHLDQLIGREESFNTTRLVNSAAPPIPVPAMRGRMQQLQQPAQSSFEHGITSSSYTVFSYLPGGLLRGETTNLNKGSMTFYRFQYEYHDAQGKP